MMTTDKQELMRDTAAKQRDYRNVVITQAILISIALVLEDLIALFGFNEQKEIFFSVFLLLGGVYYYLLWNLLHVFLRSKTIVNIILGILIVDFIFLLIAEFPFSKIVSDPVPWLITVHTVLFLIETFVIAHVFKDIFTKSEVSFDKLWGSVALFLMMAICFASIFDVINFVQPGSFGVALEPGFQTFAESLYFSLVTIGGGTASFPAISHLIRDIAAIEGISGTLYLVILIGRIIGRV